MKTDLVSWPSGGEVGGPDEVKLEYQILITSRAPEILSQFHIHDDGLALSISFL